MAGGFAGASQERALCSGSRRSACVQLLKGPCREKTVPMGLHLGPRGRVGVQSAGEAI